MKLSIQKSNLNFVSQVAEDNCNTAKHIAVANDFIFELIIPETGNITATPSITISSAALFSFLLLDDETKNSIINYYKNLDSSINLDNLSIVYLSLSCWGNTNIIINAPQVDIGLNIFSESDHMKIGFGFSFKAGITFSESDMDCNS